MSIVSIVLASSSNYSGQSGPMKNLQSPLDSDVRCCSVMRKGPYVYVFYILI